mgnify:CR=1 FL=1
MDFFDILWLLICIGLPVISGIASAKKKNAGKGKSVPQNSEVPVESDLKEIFKSIIQEMNAQDADEDEEDEDGLEEVKPAQVQVNAAEPVPAPEAPAHPAPEVRPVADLRPAGSLRPAQEGYHAAEPQPVPAYHPVSELRPTPEMRPASDLRASFTMRPVKSKAPVLQEDDKKQKEKINLRNLVIYSSIMEPKFKE